MITIQVHGNVSWSSKKTFNYMNQFSAYLYCKKNNLFPQDKSNFVEARI